MPYFNAEYHVGAIGKEVLLLYDEVIKLENLRFLMICGTAENMAKLIKQKTLPDGITNFCVAAFQNMGISPQDLQMFFSKTTTLRSLYLSSQMDITPYTLEWLPTTVEHLNTHNGAEIIKQVTPHKGEFEFMQAMEMQLLNASATIFDLYNFPSLTYLNLAYADMVAIFWEMQHVNIFASCPNVKEFVFNGSDIIYWVQQPVPSIESAIAIGPLDNIGLASETTRIMDALRNLPNLRSMLLNVFEDNMEDFNHWKQTKVIVSSCSRLKQLFYNADKPLKSGYYKKALQEEYNAGFGGFPMRFTAYDVEVQKVRRILG